MVVITLVNDIKSGVVVYYESSENDTTERPVPYYYVEAVNDNGVDVVIAYDLDEKSLKRFKTTGDLSCLTKAHTTSKVNKTTSLKGKIGKHITRLKGKHKESYFVTEYKAANFVSTVLTGTDTLTGNLEKGFKEYTNGDLGKLKMGKTGFAINVPVQEPTGVFIGVSHIHWLKDVVNPEGLSDYLNVLMNQYVSPDING